MMLMSVWFYYMGYIGLKTNLLTLLHCVFSLSSENLILLKGPSSPLNNLLDIEKVDLKIEHIWCIIAAETQQIWKSYQHNFQNWRMHGGIWEDNVLREIFLPRVTLAILVTRVSDNLSGQWKQFISPGQHCRYKAANLSCSFINWHLWNVILLKLQHGQSWDSQKFCNWYHVTKLITMKRLSSRTKLWRMS